MKIAPVARVDDALKKSCAGGGELGQSNYGNPVMTLAGNAQFETPDAGRRSRVFGFLRTDTRRPPVTERRLQLADVTIEDSNITAHNLAAGSYDAGEAMIVNAGPNAVTILTVTDPTWNGLNSNRYDLAAGQTYSPGKYELSVDLSQSDAATIMRGEMEHEDDFERAFLLTYPIVQAAIKKQAGAARVFTTSEAKEQDARAALDKQEATHKRALVELVIADLRIQHPEFLPANVVTITDVGALIEALEVHWWRCLEGLRGLSKLRDYNRSHKARSQITVQRQPAKQGAAPGAAVAFVSSPLHAGPTPRPPSPGPAWTVSPLMQGGGAPAPTFRPGAMTLNILAPAKLLGGTDKLIRFDNPYFAESYAGSLGIASQGVQQYTW